MIAKKEKTNNKLVYTHDELRDKLSLSQDWNIYYILSEGMINNWGAIIKYNLLLKNKITGEYCYIMMPDVIKHVLNIEIEDILSFNVQSKPEYKTIFKKKQVKIKSGGWFRKSKYKTIQEEQLIRNDSSDRKIASVEITLRSDAIIKLRKRLKMEGNLF